MLVGVQFPTPANGTPNEFKLYPFRLLLKLMLDDRLHNRIYDTDYAYLIAFQKECTPESYEKLVANILEWRKLTPSEQFLLLKKDEHTYVNCIYEWSYYNKTLLANAGVLKSIPGEAIGKLYHPTKTNSGSKPTGRMVRTGYAEIAEKNKDFIKLLLSKYSAFDVPIRLRDDPDRLEFDVRKQIYSFYPSELLREIGEDDTLIENLLKLPKLIEEYSKNPNNSTEYLFEQVLTAGFNMFINVEAQWVGGSGNSDIVCEYHGKVNEKFDVEAKSTSTKLSEINAGRLRVHREAIDGRYTIVITPNYVPAVKTDIRGEPIVIILASTFSEYLYNNIFHGVRKIDYHDFDEIINNNLGRDVSRLISNKTIEKFSSMPV